MSTTAAIPPNSHLPAVLLFLVADRLCNNTPSLSFMPWKASKAHRPRLHHCQHGTSTICQKGFSSLSGLTRHVNSAHSNPHNCPNPPPSAASASSSPLLEFYDDRYPNKIDVAQDQHAEAAPPHKHAQNECHPIIDGELLPFMNLFHHRANSPLRYPM